MSAIVLLAPQILRALERARERAAAANTSRLEAGIEEMSALMDIYPDTFGMMLLNAMIGASRGDNAALNDLLGTTL